jgi:tetratricopeptide (TPR) repeat protein
MKPAKRLLSLALVLALPLLLSHCSSNKLGAANVRQAKPDELAKLGAIYDRWDEPKPSRVDQREMPLDRLESMADLSLQSQDYETSLVNYLQILKRQPHNFALRYKVGVIFLLSGQYEAARKELGTVLLNQPDMLVAHEALGLVYFQEKNYSQALAEFRLVVAQEPNRAKTKHLIGVTHLAAGQFREAITALEAAARLDTRNIATLNALGQAYLQNKDYQRALTWLKKGQAQEPNNQKLNHHLGMALAGLKRYPEALEAFLKAGDEAQAYNNIGVHYFMEGRYEEAAKCFQRALELRPTFYSEAKMNLHRALEKLQETRENSS